MHLLRRASGRYCSDVYLWEATAAPPDIDLSRFKPMTARPPRVTYRLCSVTTLILSAVLCAPTQMITDAQPISFRMWHGIFTGGHAGTLTISPDRVSWEETGADANRSDNFVATCAAIKSAGMKQHSLNGSTFTIRLTNRSYTIIAHSDNDMVAAMRALSAACPQIPGPGN